MIYLYTKIIYISYIYIYIYIFIYVYTVTLYVFYFVNVTIYKLNDDTFKISLYFDFYKSSPD